MSGGTSSKFIILGLDGCCPDIIDEAINDGLMPNFNRLREEGCWAHSVPFPSAVTPGNWTSIATGSRPVTYGISDFCMHTLGENLDEQHEVFSKKTNNLSEFVWDAYSDRGYKTATISFPAALPQTKVNHLAIGDYGMPRENSEPYILSSSRVLAAGNVNPVGPYNWCEHEKVSLFPADSNPAVEGFVPRFQLDFSVKAHNTNYKGKYPFRLYLGYSNDKAVGVIVEGQKKSVLEQELWSDYFEKSFKRNNSILQQWFLNPLQGDTIIGEFRFRIVKLDLQKSDLLLYISPVYPKYFFSSDISQTNGLRERLGPYCDALGISRLLTGWLDDEAFYDEFRLQGLWQARAAIELVNKLGYKAVLTKWHAFDKFYHFFMHKVDPVALNYKPDEFEHYEKLHRMILAVADEMIGIVMDNLNKDTSLVVVSDHGLMASRRAVWVNRFLSQKGYVKYRKDKQDNIIIDWNHTQAYVSAFLLLNINLKGRDPHGIVEPGAEYENLKAELIELLRDWKDPQTGQHVLTDVFDPKKDGAFYGLGSDLDGDIRYFTRPGYTLYRSTSVDGNDLLTDVWGPYLGDHGSCRPTTRYGRGGEIGMFCAAGKGFRKGYHRQAPVFPCDIMPTLLHIAGESPLKQQEGAVLYDLIDI
ncbi:MAG: alkaline phosphatase family protein [Planctomycetota bacterium]